MCAAPPRLTLCRASVQGEPPTKRQAIDARFAQQAPYQQVQVQQQYAAALPPGMAGVMSATGTQQQQQHLSLYMQLQQRQMGAVGGLQAGALNGLQLAAAYGQNPAAMRVSVDKGRQTDYDHQFVAEDTTAKDHADEVMRRCEEVTMMLRKTLGKHTEGDRCAGAGRLASRAYGRAARQSTVRVRGMMQGLGACHVGWGCAPGRSAMAAFGRARFGATNDDGEVEYHQVEQPQMIEACGDTARFLKPYQLVRQKHGLFVPPPLAQHELAWHSRRAA